MSISALNQGTTYVDTHENSLPLDYRWDSSLGFFNGVPPWKTTMCISDDTHCKRLAVSKMIVLFSGSKPAHL